MNRIKTFLRYELKYLITREQYRAVLADIGPFVIPDEHNRDGLTYPVTSLYFDTPDYRAYWDKIDGQPVRRKVRARIYGQTQVTPDTPCFLEIKHRIHKRIAKRRALLRCEQAESFDWFWERPAAAGNIDWAVLQEVYYLYRTLRLRPSCIVRYERTAFYGVSPFLDLRITFDSNVRGRSHELTLLSTGTARDVFVLPPDRVVMEVKVNQTVPYWLVEILTSQRCTLYRISKYARALEATVAMRGRQRLLTPDLQAR